MARRAHALATLLGEVNIRWPNRRRDADGWIGDPAHAARRSDHNPNAAGVVTAQDIDEHDGQVGRTVAELLRVRRDRRVKYVIYEGRMFSSYPTSTYPAWTWRPYSGLNAHLSHVHVSVQPDPALYDDRSPWGLLAPTDQEDDMTPQQAQQLADVEYRVKQMQEGLDAVYAAAARQQDNLARVVASIAGLEAALMLGEDGREQVVQAAREGAEKALRELNLTLRATD